MEEQLNRNELAALEQGWQKLRFEIRKNKRVDFKSFEETFSATYAVLAKYATQNSVDKACVSLIAAAVLFADAGGRDLDNKHRAVLTLTERMVSCCVLNSADTLPVGTTVYIFEARKEIYIDFRNVNEAVGQLETLFEDDYWKTV